MVIFEEDTPVDLLEAVRPDVLIKGSEYTKDQVVGGSLVESYGGEVVRRDDGRILNDRDHRENSERGRLIPGRVFAAIEWIGLGLGCGLTLVEPISGTEGGVDYLQVNGSIHIHSTFSTGGESLEEIASHASKAGVDVLVVTDDDLLRVEYGLPFFRNLAYRRVENAVLSHASMQAYLDEIDRVDELYPNLLIIDGIESAPFYYWEVDWPQLRWTLRHWNKHMVAVGLGSAESYAGLPVIGGGSTHVWHWSSVALLWPALGLLYCLLLGRGKPPLIRMGVGLVSALCLVNNWPFKVPLLDAYHGDLGPAPYQHYIDYVNDKGGMALWAHPESRSTIPPMSFFGGLMEVVSETDAHAEDLVETYDYTAFAALYADRITATEPGSEWDQLLLDHTKGRRDNPIWGIGERDYHYAKKGKIDGILSVFLVREKSKRAVMEALRRGRLYATRGGHERLVLNRFVVETESARGVAGTEVESSGKALVLVDIGRIDGEAEKIRVTLIKSGEVVADLTGVTPIRLEHIESNIQEGERVYYRVMGYRRKAALISNPIFVTGSARGESG